MTRKTPGAQRNFDDIVQQADAKAIKLLDLLNDQTRHQFEFAILLHKILVGAALLVLVISICIVLFAPNANSFVQTFSLVGGPVSLLTLLLAYLRSPVNQQHQTFERAFRLNVTFLNYLHRLQNSKIMVAQILAKADVSTLQNIQIQADNVESSGDETLESLKNN